VKKFCLIGVSGAALCLGVFYACGNPLSAKAAKESASPERFLVKPITVTDRVSGREYKTNGGWKSGQIDGKYRIVSLTSKGSKKDFGGIVELLTDSHGKEVISPIDREIAWDKEGLVSYDVEFVNIGAERAVERWNGPGEDSVCVSKEFCILHRVVRRALSRRRARAVRMPAQARSACGAKKRGESPAFLCAQRRSRLAGSPRGRLRAAQKMGAGIKKPTRSRFPFVNTGALSQLTGNSSAAFGAGNEYSFSLTHNPPCFHTIRASKPNAPGNTYPLRRNRHSVPVSQFQRNGAFPFDSVCLLLVAAQLPDMDERRAVAVCQADFAEREGRFIDDAHGARPLRHAAGINTARQRRRKERQQQPDTKAFCPIIRHKRLTARETPAGCREPSRSAYYRVYRLAGSPRWFL
jgi:hypothetical protein